MGTFVGIVARNIKTSQKTGDKYGFILIGSIRRTAGNERIVLPTDKDIFIHECDLDTELRSGMEVEFDIYTSDEVRNGKHRARRARETPESRLVLMEQGGIKLLMQSTSGDGHPMALEHASVFVSWCFSEQLLRELREIIEEHKTVRLLLVWWPVNTSSDRSHEKSFEQRMLVNPFDPMVYLTFDRSGIYRVVATLVYERNLSAIEDIYLREKGTTWATDIISRNGADIVMENGERVLGSSGHRENRICWFGTGYIQPEVPEALFAKRPWDYRWLTLVLKTPPRDQCAAMWRRILFSYHIQFAWVAILGMKTIVNWVFALFAVVLFASFGLVTDMNFDAVRNPWSNSFSTVFTGIKEKTIFAITLRGKRRALWWFLHPGTLAIAASLIWLGHRVGNDNWHFPWVFFGKTILALGMLSLAVVTFGNYMDSKERVAAKARAREEAEQKYLQELESQLKPLACESADGRRPNPQSLPLKVSTLRFWASAHKQKACMPYARQ